MINGIMLQGFEWYLSRDGQYYNRIKKLVPELAAAGFDAIWLPPFCKATGRADTGYGIYDLYDLGEFDQKGSIKTKYGTKKQLLSLIKELHNNNIDVYADLVMNHKAGADYTERFMAERVDPNDRNVAIEKPHEIEGWTGFNFPGRGDIYSDFKWNYNHFTGVDFDQSTGKSGIYKIVGENKGWAFGVSSELGNYDYLMFANVDHAHPEVRDEYLRWADWLVDETGVDGFRLDALKHIDDEFITDFVSHAYDRNGDDFYIFGEYWANDPAQTGHYLYETKYKVDIFDVGLHFNMKSASDAGENYDLRRIFDNTVVKEHPQIAVTFVDNHDTQPGQKLMSFVDPWFKKIAYGLILLRRDGYPCVFYGDYFGIKGKHRVEGQKDMIDNLMYIRTTYAYGDQIDYFESPNAIGWVRMGDDEHPDRLAVAISNREGESLKMNVGEDRAGREYVDLTGGYLEGVIIDEDGNADFPIGEGGLSAWAEKQY